MARRPTPTTNELLTALTSSTMYTLGVTPEGEVRGITWDTAQHLLATRLHTTEKKAREWLLERGTEENSAFVLLRISGKLVARSDPGEYRASTAIEGWSDTNEYDVAFDRYGRPALAGARLAEQNKDLTVVLRSSLPALLKAVQRAREEKDAARTAEVRAERREFYGHHSEAMAMIEPWLAKLDRSGVHEVIRDESLLRLSNHDSAQIWGAPGGLSIELHGSEIAAFAALIEQTRKGEA